MSKAAAPHPPSADRSGRKKRPKPAAKAAPKPAGKSPDLATHGPAKSTCACGGGCPSCAAKVAKPNVPKQQPAKPPKADAAEIEARTLGPRLSLVGEPAAPKDSPAPQNGDTSKPVAPPPRRADPPALRRSRAPDPKLTRHRRLSQTERGRAEAAMEIDFSEVRLHTGSHANALAAQSGALAFAHGNHIVLSARAERLSGASYDRVISHELIHVVQQSAPPLPAPSQHERPHARAPPIRPLIRTSPQIQCWFVTDAIGGFASDVGSAVYDVGADAVGGAVELAGDVAEFVGDGIRLVVDRVAPGLWKLLTGGVHELLAEYLCKGVDWVLGKVFGGLADLDIMSAIETTFAKLASGITGIKDTIFGQLSDAVGTVLSPFVAAMEWATPLIDTAQGMVDAVTGVFSSVWDSLGAPALDFLQAVGGAVWDGFTWVLGKIWGGVKKVKDYAGWAWDELSDYFDISWGGESDVKGTLSGYATKAFDALKKGYEKIKAPLLTAVGVFLLFSPMAPIVVISVVLPPLYEKIKWLIANWDKAEVVVEARKILHEDIIPGIQNLIGGVKGALTSAAVWLAGMLGSLAGAIVRVIAAFGGGSCAKNVDKILANIEDQVRRFQTWAQGGFAGLNDALGAAFDALSAFFKPIFDIVAALIQAAVAPFTLPAIIFGAIWLLLPEKLKPPVIKFVLKAIILAVSLIPTFMPGLFPLATLFKAGLLGFLRRLLSDEIGDEKRIAACDKVAEIMRGSLSFIAGFTVGILRGLIDGIIDPFKILFMMFDLVMKGMAVVGRAVQALVTLISPNAGAAITQVNLAISGAPPPAAQTPAQTQNTAAAPAAQTAATAGPRAPPQVLDQRMTLGAQPADVTRTANTNAAPAAANQSSPPSQSVAPDSTPAAAQSAAPVGMSASGGDGATSGEDMSLESDVTDAQIVKNLPPAVAAQAASVIGGDTEFSAETAETQMRGEVEGAGTSVGSLASMLGGAWDFMINGATTLGSKAADWFMKFLEKPKYRLGSMMGWLTGTILLELLINYFTAGGYMVIQKGATWGTKLLAYFVRYLDMGGAILGVMGKGLGKLRGPVLGGLDAVSGFLSRFKFIEAILGRVRGAADWLFRFGDEIGLAADIARKGPIDGAAGRAGAGLVDDGAAGLAKQADAAPPAPAAARADEVIPPAPAGRTSDAAPTPAPASTRAADDVPPAPARAADDVPAPPPARAADEAMQAQSTQAARDAMDGAGTKPPKQGLDDAADGSRRTVDDAATPTVKDDALRATEFPQAVGAARQIAEINDAADMPVPVVMGQLLYLKRRYRWIDYFRVRPAGGPSVYKIGMVASPETEVDGHYDNKDGPEVIRRPLSPHRRPRPEASAAPRDPVSDVPSPQRRSTDAEIRQSHLEDTNGNGGMVSDDALEARRVPNRPTGKEVHTTQSMRADNNRTFGKSNEKMLDNQLEKGLGPVGTQFERVAEQVHIRPIQGFDANGNPIFANYTIYADNVVRDRATGALHILDAKTTATAPLSKNQTPGYPLIAANGGRVETPRFSGPLANRTVLPPTPVSRAVPNINLSDPNIPMPTGGLRWDLDPIPAATGGRTQFPVSPAALPHPSVAKPPTPGVRPMGNAPRTANETAEQAGERIGKHTADNAPPINAQKSVDDAGGGNLRAAQDPAMPTVRNPATKAVELAEAIAAAKTITTLADVIDTPIEVVMGQLMLLKSRYRWIDTFLATPRGGPGKFRIELIASQHDIDLITVDSIFLYHGTPQAKALGLARGMQVRNPRFTNVSGDHDLGSGLYLFDNPRNAQTYAGQGGAIIEIEVPLPHPDEIADIAIRGFGRNGDAGAERAAFLREMERQGAGPIDSGYGFTREQHNSWFNTDRNTARQYTHGRTDNPDPAFAERNIARGQLFSGRVPDHSQHATGGFGFEFDAIQWRFAEPTEDMRRQIIERILGHRNILP